VNSNIFFLEFKMSSMQFYLDNLSKRCLAKY
jgi:hypothetical protein